MKIAKLICLAAIGFCGFALASHFLSQSSFSSWWTITLLLVGCIAIAVLTSFFAEAIGDWLGLSPQIVIFQTWIVSLASFLGGVLAWIN